MMRKLMTLLIFVLGISISAQPLTFKAEIGEFTESLEEIEWEPIELGQNIYVIWDTDDDWIQVVTKTTVKYYVVTQESESSDNGERLDIVFDCITASGVERILIISWFEDDEMAFGGIHKYRWRIAFNDFAVGYYCNVVE